MNWQFNLDESWWLFLSWVLFHVAWLGLLVGCFSWLGSRVLRDQNPRLRYVWLLGNFGILMVAPFLLAGNSAREGRFPLLSHRQFREATSTSGFSGSSSQEDIRGPSEFRTEPINSLYDGSYQELAEVYSGSIFTLKEGKSDAGTGEQATRGQAFWSSSSWGWARQLHLLKHANEEDPTRREMAKYSLPSDPEPFTSASVDPASLSSSPLIAPRSNELTSDTAPHELPDLGKRSLESWHLGNSKPESRNTEGAVHRFVKVSPATRAFQQAFLPVTVGEMQFPSDRFWEDARNSSSVGSQLQDLEPALASTKLDTRATRWDEFRIRSSRCWPVLVVYWLIGMLVYTVRLLLGGLGCYCLKRSEVETPEDLVEIAMKLANRMSVPVKRQAIVVSDRVWEAIAVGFFRPVIVIPVSWVMELPPDCLRSVLAHELAHIRRYDLLWNLLQRIGESVFFFHPVVWWLSRQIRFERECCCDQLASAAIGNRIDYARALSTVASLQVATNELQLVSAFLGGPRMSLLRRVQCLLGNDSARSGLRYNTLTGVSLLTLVGFVLSLAFWGPADSLLADEQEQENTQTDQGDSAQDAGTQKDRSARSSSARRDDGSDGRRSNRGRNRARRGRRGGDSRANRNREQQQRNERRPESDRPSQENFNPPNQAQPQPEDRSLEPRNVPAGEQRPYPSRRRAPTANPEPVFNPSPTNQEPSLNGRPPVARSDRRDPRFDLEQAIPNRNFTAPQRASQPRPEIRDRLPEARPSLPRDNSQQQLTDREPRMENRDAQLFEPSRSPRRVPEPSSPRDPFDAGPHDEFYQPRDSRLQDDPFQNARVRGATPPSRPSPFSSRPNEEPLASPRVGAPALNNGRPADPRVQNQRMPMAADNTQQSYANPMSRPAVPQRSQTNQGRAPSRIPIDRPGEYPPVQDPSFVPPNQPHVPHPNRSNNSWNQSRVPVAADPSARPVDGPPSRPLEPARSPSIPAGREPVPASGNRFNRSASPNSFQQDGTNNSFQNLNPTQRDPVSSRPRFDSQPSRTTSPNTASRRPSNSNFQSTEQSEMLQLMREMRNEIRELRREVEDLKQQVQTQPSNPTGRDRDVSQQIPVASDSVQLPLDLSEPIED